MRVRTLLNGLMYSPDSAEIYSDNMDLLTRCSINTLETSYPDFRIKRFWLFTDDDGQTTLELIFR